MMLGVATSFLSPTALCLKLRGPFSPPQGLHTFNTLEFFLTQEMVFFNIRMVLIRRNKYLCFLNEASLSFFFAITCYKKYPLPRWTWVQNIDFFKFFVKQSKIKIEWAYKFSGILCLTKNWMRIGGHPKHLRRRKTLFRIKTLNKHWSTSSLFHPSAVLFHKELFCQDC